MLIDAHVHLMDATFDGQREQILERAKQAGVSKLFVICTTADQLESAIAFCQEHPQDQIHLIGSTPPHDVEARGKEFPFFAKKAREGDLKAVGETGLDYHYYASTKDLQKKYLRDYLELANECQLPIVIHCREAFSDLIEEIDQHYQRPGMLHCFTGTQEEASELLKRGWYLSFSGIVTFKKSEWLREVVRQTPLDQLFIETDAPYLAPQSHRGKMNEPAFLVETAKLVADLKGVTLEQLSEKVFSNISRLFKTV